MKKKKAPRMSNLVADEKLWEQLEVLYSGKPLLREEGGIFTNLLQAFVNSIWPKTLNALTISKIRGYLVM